MTPQVPGAPKTESKGKGCLIAFGVLAAILGLMCLVGGILAWRAAQDPKVSKVLAALGKGTKMAMEGANAPGTEELRKAGCPQAMVLDTDEMMGLVGDFIDGGLPGDAPQLGVMVMCQGGAVATSDLPSCEALAQVYLKAAKPQRPFTIVVNSGGANKAHVCQQKYDASGTPMVDDDEGADGTDDDDEDDDKAPK